MTTDEIRVKIPDTLVRIPRGELMAHPENPQTHPKDQVQGMGAVLSEVGVIEPLIVYRSPKRWPGKYVIINGHLRNDNFEISGGWPCLVAALTDEEADLAIQSFDPVGKMGVLDLAKMRAIRARTDFDDKEVKRILDRFEQDADPQEGDGTMEGKAADDKAADKSQVPVVVPEMALRPYEHYDSILVLVTKTHDWNWLCDRLQLKKVQGTNDTRYKGKVGIERAIPAARLIALLKRGEDLEVENIKLRRRLGDDAPMPESAAAGAPPKTAVVDAAVMAEMRAFK